MYVYVDERRCTGCGDCVEACPAGAIELLEGVAQIDGELCCACEACLDACPVGAILSVSEPGEDGQKLQREVQTAPARRSGSTGVAIAGRAKGALPWVGAALAFAGREVLPRLGSYLLQVWDRNNASPTVSTGNVASKPAAKDSGGRHRTRRRAGRQ